MNVIPSLRAWLGSLRQMRASLPSVLCQRFALALLIYTLTRAVFGLYNADLLGFTSASEVLHVFVGGLRFDLAGLLYVHLLVIALHLLPLRLCYRAGYQTMLSWLYWLCNVPAFLFNMGDIVYYRYTGNRTTLSVFSEFANEDKWAFVGFFLSYWPVTLTGLALMAPWIWLYRRIGRATMPELSAARFYGLGIALIFPTIALVIGGIRGGFSVATFPIAPGHATHYIARPEQRAMVLNTPFTLIRLAGKPGLSPWRYMSEEEARQRYSALRADARPSEWTGRFAGRNIVLIVWESLSREWVGSLNRHIAGYEGFTPHLDTLIWEQGFAFERAYAGGGKSIDALPALLAGVPRPGVPFVMSPYSGNALYALPHILGAEGYQTRFYHNAPNGSMGFDAMARQLGFGAYRGKDEFGDDSEFDGRWGIWDEPFLQFMARDLTSVREPFLAVEFTTTSHDPYRIPEKYHARFPEGKHPQHRCMRYTDYALAEFFRTARQQPWYQNTLFVITADHATAGDLEYYKNQHGAYAIPMIFFDPRGELRGLNTERIVQQSDLMPTLLDLLGIKRPVVAFGHNMFAEDEEHFAVNALDGAYQIIRGDYLMQYDGERVLGLYNIRLDPELKTDLRARAPEVLTEMLPLMQAYLQDFSQRMRENKLRP
ncbi:MAG: sulfatase-like hydrolase/transferase [Porphyromonas sp.]|nr:sulfatase-like hydrolase/transferase [Porphyromonas sp.]